MPAEVEAEDWPTNYFNYFTEIEERFQHARGTSLFLLSPLDWALIENWKNAGVPLEAVLAGIDDAFEKRRARPHARRSVNSLAYCAHAVMKAAKRTTARQNTASEPQSPFSENEVTEYLKKACGAMRQRPEQTFQDIAASLDTIIANVGDQLKNLEDLERRLTALEDKMVAAARSAQTDEDLFAIRESLDRELRPYRSKMTADQISMLERRYLDTAVLERSKLPRLSLFYLR